MNGREFVLYSTNITLAFPRTNAVQYYYAFPFFRFENCINSHTIDIRSVCLELREFLTHTAARKKTIFDLLLN